MKRSEIELRVEAFADSTHAKVHSDHTKPFLAGLVVGLLLGILKGAALGIVRFVGVAFLIAAVIIFVMWLVGEDEGEGEPVQPAGDSE